MRARTLGTHVAPANSVKDLHYGFIFALSYRDLSRRETVQLVLRNVRTVACKCEYPPTMIVNTTRITVQPEKRTEFFQTIRRLLDPLKKAKGCRTLDFYLDAADENSTLLVSEWETEKDLNNYLRSNDFAVLRGAITVLSIRSIDSKANVTSHLSKP